MRAMIEQEMGDKDITLAAIERLTKLNSELLQTAKGQYARKESTQNLNEKEGKEGVADSRAASNSASCIHDLDMARNRLHNAMQFYHIKKHLQIIYDTRLRKAGGELPDEPLPDPYLFSNRYIDACRIAHDKLFHEYIYN